MDTTLANVGTPLMHASVFYLLIANAIIGAVEGWILAGCLRVPRGRTIRTMIAANYVSAWVGALSLGAITQFLHAWVFTGPPLFSSLPVLITILVLAYVASVVVESPFVLLVARRAAYGRARAIRTFAAIQLLTHGVVVVCFGLVSPMSVVTDLRVEREAGAIEVPAEGWVYYFRPEDRAVWRVRLNGTRPEQVSPITGDYSEWWSSIYPVPGTRGDTWDLASTPDGERVLTGLPGRPGYFVDRGGTEPGPPTWWAADLRPADSRPWMVGSGHIAEAGIRIEEPGTRSFIRSFTFAHPFEGWRVQSQAVLPGGFIVAGFGKGQVVLIDVEGKRIGLLAEGYSPVVVLDESVGK
jgi:hypothetical protein